MEDNQKPFWKIIKEITPIKCKNATSRSLFVEAKSKKKVSDPIKISNTFCSFFTNVASTLKRNSLLLKDFIWFNPPKINRTVSPQFTFQYVPRIFIEKELKRLKRNKATGTDDLPANLLKYSAVEISSPSCFLINLSLKTAKDPAEFKHALITPIHKSGSVTTKNYRPVSILPIISKLLEKFTHKELIDHLDRNNLLSDAQFGCRKKRPPDIAATLFIENIRKNIDIGKLVGAIFIDLTKAFDTVLHSVLLPKLLAYGIKGVELEWFTNYLFSRKQQVVIQNTKSECEFISRGVPQGSNLGPVLFLLYFIDFSKTLFKSQVLMFADDYRCLQKKPNQC